MQDIGDPRKHIDHEEARSAMLSIFGKDDL